MITTPLWDSSFMRQCARLPAERLPIACRAPGFTEEKAHGLSAMQRFNALQRKVYHRYRVNSENKPGPHSVVEDRACFSYTFSLYNRLDGGSLMHYCG
jgi:CDP-glycerol glycerophosphotransferase (TagB/SpsB family)